VRFFAPLIVVCFVATGCASKKYVQREVGEVNKKVEGLSGDLEQTQQRVKANEAGIEKAQQGVTDAKGSAEQAMTQALEASMVAKAATGKLIYTVTLSNDKVTFPLNGAEIGDDAKALVDEALGPFKAENRNVFLEIEGHTCSAGPEKLNHELGLARATAVRDYLHGHHGFALSRMEVISYGESKPAVENDTRENRAKNRRVVIKVVE
jgi:peptidoglycan-associated lipoprotein